MSMASCMHEKVRKLPINLRLRQLWRRIAHRFDWHEKPVRLLAINRDLKPNLRLKVNPDALVLLGVRRPLERDRDIADGLRRRDSERVAVCLGIWAERNDDARLPGDMEND